MRYFVVVLIVLAMLLAACSAQKSGQPDLPPEPTAGPGEIVGSEQPGVASADPVVTEVTGEIAEVDTLSEELSEKDVEEALDNLDLSDW